MKYSEKDLIEYRKKRAFETFEEALILAQKNHWNAVANRLYYSAFYMINALFIKKQINTKTHSGVKSEFHNSFIKTRIIDKEKGKLYNRLFNLRQEGDYIDFQTLKEEVIRPYIHQTKSFIDEIAKLL